MIRYEIPRVGDQVFVRLNDAAPSGYGTTRFGNVADVGVDVLEAEAFFRLDDGQPPIYLSWVADVTIRPRVAAVG